MLAVDCPDGEGVGVDKDRPRAGVGTSQAADAAQAGRTAAAAALAGLAGEPAALFLVYASIRYQLPALLSGIRAVTGDVPLAGATSSGHFHNGTMTPAGQGVAVLALSAGPYQFGVGSVTGLRDNASNAGRTVARAARAAAGPPRSPHAALLVLADGLAGHQQEFLTGMHKVTGAAVPVVGGAAGDDARLCQTFVFHGDQVLTDAAVGVWIGSPWPLTVVAEHGWQPVGLPRMITKVDGPVVHEIDARPAAEIFRDCYWAHHPDPADDAGCRCPCCVASQDIRQEPSGVRVRGYHSAHALGLIEPDGSQLIRGAYIDDNGMLRTFCSLPTYSAVQIMAARPDDLLDVTDDVVTRTMAGRDASVLLAFSCVARLDVLGERGPQEPARLQAAAGSATTFGFYTYGEFARTSSVAGYHNATVTAIAL